MTHKMYHELADWWPLLSDPADYEEEAAFFVKTLLEAGRNKPNTVLELGSGGGNNALHMKEHFDLTLVDLSPGMIEVSRALNPACRHHVGDMRTLRLDKEFDAVFIHDAIEYMTSLEDLRLAMETAFVHCKSAGLALFVPDETKENFVPETDCGGHDGPKRSMRYLEWQWDPDPADSTYLVDYTYTLREEDGNIRIIHDRHTFGLFSRAEWIATMQQVGFEPLVLPFHHSEFGDEAHEVFVGIKS